MRENRAVLFQRAIVLRGLARENYLESTISGGTIMATAPVSQTLNRGGSFLITKTSHQEVFTPADLTDDQRLIGQTAEEFMQKEVIPEIPELEAHKDNQPMVQALKKAGEIGLLGGGIPEAYGGTGLEVGRGHRWTP